MKRMIFALIGFTAVYAEPNMAIAAKIVPEESRGYFIFSDGTFWKVSSFIKRWRTPLEWISGDDIYVPENYVCSVQDWSFADEFEAYPKYGNIRVNESDASNEEDLKKHSHVLVNIRTGKTLFGTPIHPADFLVQIYDEGYNEGYGIGYSRGYNSGYSAGKDAVEQQ
jgi:hypothetical protein